MLNLCTLVVKFYVDSAKYGIKEPKSYKNISMSLDSVNKP